MNDRNLTDKYKGRLIFLAVLVFLAAAGMIGRLVNIQIVNGADYAERANRKITRTVNVSAPRGKILDRYGRPLVTNRMGFQVVLNKVFLPADSQNDIILKLMGELKQETLTFTDSLPVSNYPYDFNKSDDQDEQTKIDKQIKKLKSFVNVDAGANAGETMTALYKKYKLENFSPENARLVAGVRYEMDNRSFSATNPFIIATDVDTSVVTVLKERYTEFPGIEVQANTVRQYTSPGILSHILGRVGSIYKDEADDYINKGYDLSDIVGKDGIEKTMEQYLRGTAGESVIEQTSRGKTTSSNDVKQPISGSDVELTIDKRLQEAAEASLAKNVQNIAVRGRTRAERAGADVNGGAAVAIDVKTGEVLAMASYPTFDLTNFMADYQNLINDKKRPMFNRAIGGTYEPGSTFKMATALAGLETGAISTATTVNCTGKYDFYKPQIYYCWIYTEYGRGHGTTDVRRALQESCNIFFYNTGRLVGIDRLNEWCTKLGLGQKTGIELPGEATGILAGPSEREKSGQRWYGGDTLQAAIGQSDNLFSPLQIANYVATVINGGTRYKPHIVKSIQSPDGKGTSKVTQPEVAEKINIKENNYRAILDGMRSAAEVGTASSVFKNYPIKVGGKTGTASVGSGTANGVFVAFAPFDNPEIAVAVIVEHGSSGNSVAPVARDIFDAYFAKKAADNKDLPHDNTLLP
ncbi:MAG: penicillin-binding protein 2 [Bacillota bacterium]|nr:penicillin-binding protein 2 [Bacillota bacterium]